MEGFIHKINNLLKNPRLEDILTVFEIDGYIRLNRVYISPFSLRQLLIKLVGLDLVSWQMTPSGLFFQFRAFCLKFYGTVNIVVKQKVFCIEIDFDPSIDGGAGVPVLRELERYLKGCDALFFMTYFMDIDKEILHNPLSESLDFLYRKNSIRK
ncbi:hypothetical protein EHEL_050150 [Encephalitozoon hellem ATCC 50504]|uniref:DUF5091 domain-containing protein n=1 Tax=Encephalitozoon hellem TaxID=27973 RepID=A0A9Q9F9G8_ENCHE|nr:uncharacterized protein EHEL_050150 [Encephalitozoon hellem ATCC 50504]AFM98226.1 hypothetical protein EHEL_050150 [Encephalitozoon hellem ATCC 50504]UTX43102.1 DUF5091 domain-containing protein [Encephalitozoon hellem]WEL38559.1 DUF5091 domain-containing protein [Encephalitozoon hellem]|eukprot:XP_003887207.1 hypothetical protein EHEL_050150 [Encephalitozoon hellem ATCC 50504]